VEAPSLPDPELLREVCNYRMPFGKHAGQLIINLPEAYLAWFARKGMPAGKLGMMLETALVIRQNGLDALVKPLLEKRR
jgi:uncharacterized protein (DUF3820 family)